MTDWKRRAAEADQELAEVRRRGREREPLLRRLEGHARDNHFAARLFAALEQTRRRTT